MGFIGLQWVFTRFYLVPLGFTGFFGVFTGLNPLYWVFREFYWVLMRFDGG